MTKRTEQAVRAGKGFSRRDLLRYGVLGGAGLWLLGCGGESGAGGRDGAVVGPDGTVVGLDGAVATDDAGHVIDAATPQVCDDTAENIEGPYYRAGAPTRGVLVDGTTPGIHLTLSGIVRAVGSCAPLAGATVDLWQADAAANYDSVGYNFRGKVITDANGAYQFETVIPGHYLNGAQYRPAHIHTKVSAPGFPLLTTQLYFVGDPYNAIDPFIVSSLIMPTTDVGTGKAARFDFALQQA
jgi:protocatechuate 3,4-dioxygenase beta subunit